MSSSALAAEVDLRRFAAGESLIRGGTRLDFHADKWIFPEFMRKSTKLSEVTLGFGGNLPCWVVQDFKLHVAEMWWSGIGFASYQGLRTALVHLGRGLPDFAGQPTDLGRAEARAFTRYLIDRETPFSAHSLGAWESYVNSFATFLRRHYPASARDFVIRLPSKVKQRRSGVLAQDPEKFIPSETLRDIVAACVQEENVFEAALQEHRSGVKLSRNRGGTGLEMLRARAIKAQLVKLLICSGRRVSAVCDLPCNVRVEPFVRGRENAAGVPEAEDAWGVWVYFTEQKSTNAPELVFCPYEFGQIALDAITRARRYGAELRAQHPKFSDHLFVAAARGFPTSIDDAAVARYLTKSGSSLLDRYQIRNRDEAAHWLTSLTSHNFRTTRATLLWLGGIDLVEVARDLGHVVPMRAGIPHPDMAGLHYVAGIPEVHTRSIQALKASSVNASSASVDTIRTRPVRREQLNARRTLPILQASGTAMQLIRYGYCRLPASRGPCLTASECWEGQDPSQLEGGDGCEHLEIAPHAVAAFEERERFLTAQVQCYEHDPAYAHFLEQERRKLASLRRQLRVAYELRDDLEQEERAYV